MTCAYCHKEPCVAPFQVGQKCLEALRENPQSFIREKKLPPVNPNAPKRDGGRNRSEQELAENAGEYRAMTG